MDQKGGLLVVPSAPSLCQMAQDPLLKRAHQEADFAVVDGGFVALVLKFLGKPVVRISGLQLLQKTVVNPEISVVGVHDRKILWVVPNREEEQRIKSLIFQKGLSPDKQEFYFAPFYKEDAEFDDELLKSISKRHDPDWVVICLGGGRQEKLGYYLRSHCRQLKVDGGNLAAGRENGPVIFCTGAAIAFFTGGQANIPTWADRLYLGWFFRICQKPGVFLPRYVKALRHFPLLLLRERKSLFQDETE
jgi:UDP-N-acetyl-D-mannosaminuronic acid transferase (WecB/TagA/CpsF family)